MLIFLKVTLHIEPLPQKHVYQVFQQMMYIAEGHGQMNLPGKSSSTSTIINKYFQKSNFYRNDGVTININASVKNSIFGISLNVVAKMENIQQILWTIQQLRVMKLQGHTTKKQKLFQQIFVKRNQSVKRKISIICFLLITIMIADMIAVSIFYHLIKYRAKQKHL